MANKMNIKRYIIATIALFLFIFIYETVIHSMLLLSLYSKTPTIWRNLTEMKSFVPFNIGVMALLSISLTFIFTRFFKSGGWMNGLRFGFYMGILSGIQAAGAYYYLPISFSLAMVWFVFGVIESTLGGMIIGALYKK